MVEPTQKLTKQEIEKLAGKYDEDGFYLLKDGGYYDPLGWYFDAKGLDAEGGRYSDAGVYIPAIKVPERLAKDGIKM